MISPTIFRRKGATLQISETPLQQLISNPQPILWCNDGLYALIPIERIRNDLDVLAGRRKFIGKNISLVFYWGEAIEIPVELGRELERGGRENGKSIDIGGLPPSHQDPAAPIH